MLLSPQAINKEFWKRQLSENLGGFGKSLMTKLIEYYRNLSQLKMTDL